MFWNKKKVQEEKKVEEKPKKRMFQVVETVEIFYQPFVITYESDRQFAYQLTEYEYESERSDDSYFQPSEEKYECISVVNLKALRDALINNINYKSDFHTFDYNTDTPMVVSLKNIKKVTFDEPESMGTADIVSWKYEE